MISVEASVNDANFIFHFYKQLIELRHQDSVIQKGEIEFIDLDHPSLFNYIKTYDGIRYAFINNFFAEEVTYSLPGEVLDVVLSNYGREAIEQTLQLKPYETLVVKNGGH